MFKSDPPFLSIPAPATRITARITIICFQRLAHSSQFHFSSNSSRINRSRTLCKKHRGVGVPLPPFHPSLPSARPGLTRPNAADTIVSLAPEHFFAVPALSQGGGPL